MANVEAMQIELKNYSVHTLCTDFINTHTDL